MNIKILQFILPFRNRSGFRAWFRHFTKLTAVLALYGTVCFLLAGWDLLKAVSAGLATAPVFVVAGEMLWKAGIVAKVVWDWLHREKE